MKRGCTAVQEDVQATINQHQSMDHNGIEITKDRSQSPPSKRLNSIDNDKDIYVLEKMGLQNGNGLTHDANTERIAILDFGAQYGKVIDRRVRESKVLSDMFPLNTKSSDILAKGNFKGIIISGGPNSVYADGAPTVDPEIFSCGLPVLGICYGFQLMNKYHGGNVTKEHIREDGQCVINVDNTCSIFHGLDNSEEVLLTHGDSVSADTVADGFKVVARSGGHVAGIACEERKLYGVQFHPEVDLTTHGKAMFDNFLFRVANCKGDYTMASREETCIEEIQSIVKDKKVLVMVSGGVDSTVCAALLHKALGSDRVTAIHIDNGFMRHEESDAVITSLNAINLKVHRYNCLFDFMHGTVNGQKGEVMLDNTVDPETKRQIIGNTFIRVKDRVMKKLKLDEAEYFLAQGTLRPDLIESASALASGHADTIKTHHNDTALVRQLRDAGRVIEPLKDFHKDEVRELGASLGLPEEIVQRQPFPGPGLAIRILCADKPFKCADFETTHSQLNVLVNLSRMPTSPDDIAYRERVLTSLNNWGIASMLEHKFEMNATLLPIKSVGVQGDSRSYSYVAAISTSQSPIPWRLLSKYAKIIPKLMHNINRVVYVFGPPVAYPVHSITPTYLCQASVEKLQKADKIATDALFGKGLDGKKSSELVDCGRKIQQMPVVMVPVHFDRDPATAPNSYQHSFCIRPFITADFMTGIAAVPGEHIPEKTVLAMADGIISRVLGSSRVMIDLTSKPPGTTEWE